MHSKNLIAAIVTGFSLLSVSAFGEEAHHDEKKKAGPITTVPVSTVERLGLRLVKVGGGTIETRLVLSGKADLVPARSQHLHPKFPGVVRDVPRSVGDRVTNGTVLARIENSVGIQSSDLVAGVAGVVLARDIAPGQAVDETVQAFVIGDTRVLQARLIAYPRDLVTLSLGQSVSVRSLTGEQKAATKITYIAPVLDGKSRTAMVLADLVNEDNAWRPGQFINASVVIGTSQAASLLPSGIASTPEDSLDGRVFVRVGQNFVLRAIRVGRRDEQSDEVLSGLATGDEVIAAPFDELTERFEAIPAEAHSDAG